jgi:hypothetical protein
MQKQVNSTDSLAHANSPETEAEASRGSKQITATLLSPCPVRVGSRHTSNPPPSQNRPPRRIMKASGRSASRSSLFPGSNHDHQRARTCCRSHHPTA